ncbi:hypothetical protein [Rhizobium sp. AAP43]|uniref:hypothetical protein n=1 Tax=Rhizobium sp. AAP43 TaxID=1523420 RepID=UPI0006B8CC86|nr:hypothetical protein [Rhizobium sp. AAP43]KPF43697.1 hypothetical protein IP76_12375 [Rhizobium sp. AAP43]
MNNIMPLTFLALGILVVLTAIIYAFIRIGGYWLTGLLSCQRRFATVLQILVVIAIAAPFLFLSGDILRGRILGIFALTTTDPRELFGRFENSTSLEPVTFEFPDSERLRSPTVMPQMRLAIPRAYINRTSPLNSGNGILSVGLNVISSTFEPYRLGIRRIAAERKASGLPAGRRKGEADPELNIVLRTDPVLSEEERQRTLRDFVLNRNASDDACIRQAGPFPGSVEYRPRDINSPRSAACLHSHERDGFFAVLIYRDGRVIHSVICREATTPCFVTGYRQKYWFYYINFSRFKLAETLNFLQRTDELLSQFEIRPDTDL